MAATIMHVATCIVLVVAFMDVFCAAQAVGEVEFKSSGIKTQIKKRDADDCAGGDFKYKLTVLCGGQNAKCEHKETGGELPQTENILVGWNNVKIKFCAPKLLEPVQTMVIKEDKTLEVDSDGCVEKSSIRITKAKTEVVLQYTDNDDCEKSYTLTILSCSGKPEVTQSSQTTSVISYEGNGGHGSSCLAIHREQNWRLQFYIESNAGCYFDFRIESQGSSTLPYDITCEKCDATGVCGNTDPNKQQCKNNAIGDDSDKRRYTFNFTKPAYKSHSGNKLVLQLTNGILGNNEILTLDIGKLRKIVDPAKATLKLDSDDAFILNNERTVQAAVYTQDMPESILKFCVDGLQEPLDKNTLVIDGQSGTLTYENGVTCISRTMQLELGNMNFNFQEKTGTDCLNREGTYTVNINLKKSGIDDREIPATTASPSTKPAASKETTTKGPDTTTPDTDVSVPVKYVLIAAGVAFLVFVPVVICCCCKRLGKAPPQPIIMPMQVMPEMYVPSDPVSMVSSMVLSNPSLAYGPPDRSSIYEPSGYSQSQNTRYSGYFG